jgi:predicted nucleic acid-binding protein
MIVVDASVVIHVLLEANLEPSIIDTLEAANGMIAPYLIDFEVISGIRKQFFLKKIDLHRAQTAIADFEDFSIDRRATAPLIQRIWSLRDNLTSYDAAYVALAENLQLQLMTRDRRIARVGNLNTSVLLV